MLKINELISPCLDEKLSEALVVITSRVSVHLKRLRCRVALHTKER